jgi:hypothetical protein
MAEMLQGVVRIVWSDGGQRVARRNAWAAMAANAKRARERAEADAAMTAEIAGYEMWVASAHG